MTKPMSMIRFVVTYVVVPLVVLFVGMIVLANLAMAVRALDILAGFYYAIALISRTMGVSVVAAYVVLTVVIYVIGLPVVLWWERRRATQ